MRKHQIPLEQTTQFSKLFLDYLNQDGKLASFYKYPPSLDSFDKAIKDVISQRFNRKLLVDVITEQYSKSDCRLPTADCRLLLDDNTFTVCMGHQLCLFTGPLYFIYKIISTINLAEVLKKKYPANNFVPVYWMASEDHDFEEVNHVNVFRKKLEWKNKQGGVLGKYSTEGISFLIEELKPILGDSKNAKEIIELLQNAYIKRADLASATRYLVNELFGQYGFVIIDPNDACLKKEFSEIIADDIFNNTGFKKVEETIAQLEKIGHKSQVNPREINIFYLTDNQRNRIVRENNKFNIVDSDKSFTETELKEALKSHPERFSPNVVTRPLYQQRILPNLAYVGGPAEVAYWLEYKGMFDHYKISFPVLIPRNFVMLLDDSISERLTKLGLEPEDVFLSVNEMAVKYISSISGDKVSFNAEREQLMKQYKSIEEKLVMVDKSLPSAAGAELKHQINALDALEKKMLRAFKKKNEEAMGQIQKLKDRLFPGGALQERYDNFIPFYLKYGMSFIEQMKVNLSPQDFQFTILLEK
ncbi:MAG: bacillithiol biosynthesis cysteine-adding enzyme BshC [Bacteroidetes bacterium]|nr:MAG: bacillithiol biosynthesis cysteine-adding enzyme BshC [Bacteroidota bacterium]